MKGIPWRFLIEVGARSREKTEKQLNRLGKDLGILVHLDEMDGWLAREFKKWKRKQLLASLRGEDPASIEPPATLRAELARAFVQSDRKLVLSLEEFDIVESEEDDND